MNLSKFGITHLQSSNGPQKPAPNSALIGLSLFWPFTSGNPAFGNFTVNTTIKGGLEKFLRQPSGEGEATMIYLALNVYALEYLMSTNQLSKANEQNAYRFIQSGKLS